jgi:hypothetical protein
MRPVPDGGVLGEDLRRLEWETFEVVDMVDLAQEMGATTSCSCTCSSTCSCSTSSCCGTTSTSCGSTGG